MDTDCNWMWLPPYTIHSSGILPGNWNIQLPKPLVNSAERLGCQTLMAHRKFSYVKVTRDLILTIFKVKAGIGEGLKTPAQNDVKEVHLPVYMCSSDWMRKHVCAWMSTSVSTSDFRSLNGISWLLSDVGAVDLLKILIVCVCVCV